MTRYLTTQEILYMHQRTLERTGGAPGVRDNNLLEATLNRPLATFNGTELYPTIPLKGAVLMYSLVINSLFMDANKRMGLQALDVFLRLNNLRLVADVAERYQFLVDVANETLSIQQMADWIEQHTEEAPPPPKPAPRTRSGTAAPRRRIRAIPPEALPPQTDTQ